MRLDFDYKFTGQDAVAPIDYGFMNGSDEAIFIKAGLDGTMYGYENKYLLIADQLNSLYGYTVMVASNPSGAEHSLDEGVNILKDYLFKQGFESPTISFMGFSNGAYLGFTEGYRFGFDKYLLINSPLMVNYHKIKAGLAEIANKEVLIIYGEKDPSIKYSEMLKASLTDTVKLRIIPGADHQFKGRMDTFVSLPIEFFKKS